MRERWPSSPSLRAWGLRRINLFLAEDFAEGIRQFARELSTRQQPGPALVAPEWRLSLVDAVCGPEPETAADRQRHRDRERLQRAFPEIDREGAGAVISWHGSPRPMIDRAPRTGNHLTLLDPRQPCYPALMDQSPDAPPQPAEYHRRKAAQARQQMKELTTQVMKARLLDLAVLHDTLADEAERGAGAFKFGRAT
jgi:hypothetical protein